MFCVITQSSSPRRSELDEREVGVVGLAVHQGREAFPVEGPEALGLTTKYPRCARPPSGRRLPISRARGAGSRGSQREPICPPR